jgi:hypothetical protein
MTDQTTAEIRCTQCPAVGNIAAQPARAYTAPTYVVTGPLADLGRCVERVATPITCPYFKAAVDAAEREGRFQ